LIPLHLPAISARGPRAARASPLFCGPRDKTLRRTARCGVFGGTHTPSLENFWHALQVFAGLKACAKLVLVDVVLRKLGRKGGRVVAGRLVRAPRSGSVVVIEFPDGLHEYVTTPVKRVLRLAGDDVFFLQTANSCYRLEVHSGQEVMLDSVAK
jgi:hypothetical protein